MKTWYITGASTGLGRCYAEAALERGDWVVAASIDSENMADYPSRYGERVLVQRLDVTDREMVRQSFDRAVERFGQIDICVNNAGYMQCGAVEEMSEEEARRIFDCNFFGTLFVTQQAARHMRQRRSGVIVQTASLAALDTIGGEGLYGATKHAVRGMSQALRMELEPFGVKVICVCPGPIRTEMAKRAKLCALRIPEYDGVLRAERERWGNNDNHDCDVGDPERCAQVLLRAVDSPNPPRQLIFTSFACGVFRSAVGRDAEDLTRWYQASAACDITESKGPHSVEN